LPDFNPNLHEMDSTRTEMNTQKNEVYYDDLYSQTNIQHILDIINDIEGFLKVATTTHISWVGLYLNNFQAELKGKKVLEMGCGDCANAAVMAVLGAEVYANDISSESGRIIEKLNNSYAFEKPIQFIYGDFLKADMPENFFDIIVGKAFVHHLTNDQEIEFTEKNVRILKSDGQVRYQEPAVNNKILDAIRWAIPMKDRPAKWQKAEYKVWKETIDMHPIRDNSSANYRRIGKKYFEKTEIYCIGSIEKLERLIPVGEFNRKFRRFAFRLEKWLPGFFRNAFARSQVVIYKNPKKN
jgi:2-polyprenyl-3-methyl-5-hydroxy-6-metoxy-1,4-benzoquinol methylase